MAEATGIGSGNGQLPADRVQEDKTYAQFGGEEMRVTASGAVWRTGTEETITGVRVLNVRHIPSVSFAKHQHIRPVPTHALYREPSVRLNRALSLARDLMNLLGDAISASRDGEALSVDDAVRRARVSLVPELFCIRELGDGFGMLVNAVQIALDQLKDGQPSIKQLGALRSASRKLSREPFMDGDAATDAIMALEDAGLAVDLEALAYLADALESTR